MRNTWSTQSDGFLVRELLWWRESDETLAALLDCLDAFGAPPRRLTAEELKARMYARRRLGWVTLGLFAHELAATASVHLEPKLIHGGGLAGHVEDVAVLPARRGSGLGRAVVRGALDYCVWHKCYRVTLACKEELVPFYAGLQFTRSGAAMRFACPTSNENRGAPSGEPSASAATSRGTS